MLPGGDVWTRYGVAAHCEPCRRRNVIYLPRMPPVGGEGTKEVGVRLMGIRLAGGERTRNSDVAMRT